MAFLQRTMNRGSVSTGYDIDNSVKFEDVNDEYLTRTNASGTNDKTFTVSFWFKRTKLGGVQELWDGGVYSEATRIGFGLSSDELWLDIGKSTKYRSSTTQQFRDTSAWYHIVWKVDTTQSTEADRFRVYVNGAEITDWASRQYPTQNFETSVASGLLARIGSYDATYHGSSGYMAEFNYLDGLAVGPTEFGEYDDDSGIWIPKEYTGSYPGQSAYLDFKDGANLGANAKGDDANWTEVNLTAADQSTDTPTNNFCTLNPLMANAGPSNYLPITEGGTKAVNTAAAYKIANSTFGVTSGKWYWEVKATDVNGVTGIGVTMPHYWDTDYTLGGCIILSDGRRYNNSSATSGVTNTYTDGDIIGFALDMDATPPTLQVYKNNTSEANLMNGLSINGAGAAFLPEKEDGYFPKVVGYNANTFECNFGGYTSFSISSAASDANGYGTFEYAPPTGYYALCGKNLAEFGGTA